MDLQVLDKFLSSPARTADLGLVDPLEQGGGGPSAAASSTQDTIEDDSDEDEKPKGKSKGKIKSNGSSDKSRIRDYAESRNSADANTSSRMSPYLTSGIVSARMVLNKAKKMGKGGKLESGRDTGIGMWVQEVAWRDFYSHVSLGHSSYSVFGMLTGQAWNLGFGRFPTNEHG
jgi:deoxyribodipyrimidine photolyase